MPPLARTRKGWENEHLATYILSRIAFVAHPFTVADDVGTDLFCTIFGAQGEGAEEQLFPRNSFAIQVKSSPGDVDFTSKIDYLDNLELPFFLGIIDRQELTLQVHSGECIPLMFSHYGRPDTLKLCPGSPQPNYGGGKDACRLLMPMVTVLLARDDKATLASKADELGQLCRRMHRNISAKVRNQFVFETDNYGSRNFYAGGGSAQTFREDFIWHLAEVFYNLEWALDNSGFNAAEFSVYERLLQELVPLGLLQSRAGLAARERYRSLKQSIERRHPR